MHGALHSADHGVAEGKTEETPVCTCETVCTAEAMNAECPACGVEGALAENCGKHATEESGQTGTSDDAPVITAADVQALINALPESETIGADNAADVKAQLEAIDEAKVQLSDEDFAVLDFTRYDAAATILMVLSGEPGATFVPQAASSHTHCICGGETRSAATRPIRPPTISRGTAPTQSATQTERPMCI